MQGLAAAEGLRGEGLDADRLGARDRSVDDLDDGVHDTRVFSFHERALTGHERCELGLHPLTRSTRSHVVQRLDQCPFESQPPRLVHRTIVTRFAIDRSIEATGQRVHVGDALRVCRKRLAHPRDVDEETTRDLLDRRARQRFT